MNKIVHQELSILKSSKMLMYEFWYYYVKPTFGEKVKWFYKYIDVYMLM